MARTLNLGSTEAKAAAEDRGGFSLVPAGTYPAQLYKVARGEFSPESESGKAGFGKLTFTFKITEGDFKGQFVTLFNVVDSPTFAKGGLNFWLIQFFTALGVEDDLALPESEEEWGDYVGEDFAIRVDVVNNTYKGNTTTRNEVKHIGKASDVDDSKVPTKDTPVVARGASGSERKGSGDVAQPKTGGVEGNLGF